MCEPPIPGDAIPIGDKRCIFEAPCAWCVSSPWHLRVLFDLLCRPLYLQVPHFTGTGPEGLCRPQPKGHHQRGNTNIESNVDAKVYSYLEALCDWVLQQQSPFPCNHCRHTITHTHTYTHTHSPVSTPSPHKLDKHVNVEGKTFPSGQQANQYSAWSRQAHKPVYSGLMPANSFLQTFVTGKVQKAFELKRCLLYILHAILASRKVLVER